MKEEVSSVSEMNSNIYSNKKSSFYSPEIINSSPIIQTNKINGQYAVKEQQINSANSYADAQSRQTDYSPSNPSIHPYYPPQPNPNPYYPPGGYVSPPPPPPPPGVYIPPPYGNPMQPPPPPPGSTTYIIYANAPPPNQSFPQPQPQPQMQRNNPYYPNKPMSNIGVKFQSAISHRIW